MRATPQLKVRSRECEVVTMQRYVDEFETVPVLILPCLVRYRAPTSYEGASIFPSCQNILLAARALGYGAALTGWHQVVETELRPLLGRVFRSGEDGAAKERLAVLSEPLWRRRFGGNPAVIGQAIDLDGNRSQREREVERRHRRLVAFVEVAKHRRFAVRQSRVDRSGHASTDLMDRPVERQEQP